MGWVRGSAWETIPPVPLVGCDWNRWRLVYIDRIRALCIAIDNDDKLSSVLLQRKTKQSYEFITKIMINILLTRPNYNLGCYLDFFNIMQTPGNHDRS